MVACFALAFSGIASYIIFVLLKMGTYFCRLRYLSKQWKESWLLSLANVPSLCQVLFSHSLWQQSSHEGIQWNKSGSLKIATVKAVFMGVCGLLAALSFLLCSPSYGMDGLCVMNTEMLSFRPRRPAGDSLYKLRLWQNDVFLSHVGETWTCLFLNH